MTTNAQLRIMAIIADIENQYNGNRTAKMEAIFDTLLADGVTSAREQRQGAEAPELWADTPRREVNKGAIYNAWKKWNDRRLGVTPEPRQRRSNARPAGVDYNEFTFGVEFECGFKSGRYATSADAINALLTTSRRFGINVINFGSANHTDRRDAWKICSDASLDYSATVEYMVEIVSPILKGVDGWKQLEMMCDVFSLVGITVNGTCGTHVHLGVKDETWATLRNVGINYSLAYKAYCKALHSSRRASRWSATYSEAEVNALRGYQTPDDMFTGSGLCSDAPRGGHYVHSRYHAVNYVAYWQRKTLEFRQHQGTVDFRKIQSWLKDKMELITWSRTNVLNNYTDDINAMAWQSEDTRCNFLMREIHYAA